MVDALPNHDASIPGSTFSAHASAGIVG